MPLWLVARAEPQTEIDTPSDPNRIYSSPREAARGIMIGQLHPQAHMIEFVQAIREELRELRSENIADFAATAVLRRLLLDLDPVMAATSRSRSRFNLANRSSFKCASIACAGANG